MRGSRGWGVCLAAVLALLPLCLTAVRAEETAGDAGPLISPEEMLAVDQVRPGMKGYGKSVFEGTKIERFNVTVVGVLKKIDFGGDMILIRIDDGPPVTSGAGVSAGMSGSPIYVDGKLVGALAFAWPFARQPLAGVTPIAQMLENYRPGSAPPPPAIAQSGDLKPEGGPLKLDGQLFARATVVPDRGLAASGRDGTLYLAPVATPVMLSGMGRVGIEEMKRRLGRFSALVQPGPGKTDLPPGERPKIEPGSAVGVQLLGGDVDATAVGTVTYVKGNHVVAFGHPMFGLGTIAMPMTTAYIHGVISSQEVSFKLGSPVETVGQISQDRNWSIGGQLGLMPRTVQAEFAITDSSRGVKRSYNVVSAVHREFTPMLLYGSFLNAVNSVSPPTAGTTRGVVEIWARGMPVIRRENVFAMGERKSALEQLFGDPLAGLPLVELLQILDVLENNTFGSVPVERLRVTVDVSEKKNTAAIERAYADRKRVKPGEKVKIGIVIRPVDAPKEVREFEVEIPRNIPGGKIQIGVAGGGAAERVRQYMQISRPTPKTLEQLVGQIAGREQNNELTIQVAQPVVGVSVSGREFPNLPNVVVEVLTGANPSGIRMVPTHTRQTYPMPWVLTGGQLLTLQVNADEKDKSGPALSPSAGLGGLTSLLDLFRLGMGGDISTDDSSLDDESETDTVGIVGAPLPAPLASRGGRPATKGGAEEPAMPSFQELQRILEEDGGSSAATEGGPATTVRKGVARAPGVWRMSTAKDFQSGKLEGVLVTSRGELALAPKADSLLTSPERFFWAQATDGAGNVYVGGWLDGSIVKIDAAGKLSTLFSGDKEVAISALTSDADGTLYAAAEPSGTIYRVDPSGKASALCRLPDQRVWVLKKSGDALYAGTGSDGNLYRIGMDGNASVVFQAPDRHIFALADDGKGTLYWGTYPRGKLFRLREGKVEPLFELPTTTVTALACDGKGNLYIGTSPRAAVVKLTPGGQPSVLFQSTEKHVFSLMTDEEGNVYAAAGRPAKVYRIAPDRTVSTLWDPQAAYVLSLSRDGSGNLYATTAGPTQIVRLGARPAATGAFTSTILNAGNVARWGTVRWSGAGEGVQIQTRSGNTAYPDATWSPWSEPATRATGEPVKSPGGQYLQYRILFQAKEGSPSPALRNLELFYRTRNRAPEVTIASPAASETLSGTRALRWAGKDADSDRLKYDIYYQKENTDAWVKIGSRVSPAEEEDETEEAGLPGARGQGPGVGVQAFRRSGVQAKAVGSRQKVVGGRQVAVGGKPKPGSSTLNAQRSTLNARRVQTTPQGLKQLLGGDDGTGSVLSGTDETESLDLDDLTGGACSITWNTKRLPDGRYRIKVVASDALTCPDEPATGEAVSEWVLVDNKAPQVLTQLARRVGPAPPVEIPVKDAGTYVASAEYRLDTGEWIAGVAADGILDSAEETVRLDPARLKPGRHVLEIRVRDAAGNEATAKIPYLIAAPKPAGKTK
jgi:SpoIVB peptidase S55